MVAVLFLATGAMLTEAAPSAGISVEPSTDPLIVKIGMRPGLYPVSETLHLELEAATPGWGLWIESTSLSYRRGEKICAREVCLTPGGEGGGDPIPLHRPALVVEGGETGVTQVALDLALNTESFKKSGTYTGNIQVGVHEPRGPAVPLLKIPLRVEVEPRVSHRMNGGELYLEFGRFGEDKEKHLGGTVDSDVPVTLRLSVSEGRIDSVPLVEAKGRGGGEAVPVPIGWSLAEGGSDSHRRPDATSRDGRSISWDIYDTPGEADYELRSVARTGARHVPGTYGMSVEISIMPRP